MGRIRAMDLAGTFQGGVPDETSWEKEAADEGVGRTARGSRRPIKPVGPYAQLPRQISAGGKVNWEEMAWVGWGGGWARSCTRPSITAQEVGCDRIVSSGVWNFAQRTNRVIAQTSKTRDVPAMLASRA